MLPLYSEVEVEFKIKVKWRIPANRIDAQASLIYYYKDKKLDLSKKL